MTETLEPIWVADVHDPETWPPRDVNAVLDWARSQGVNPIDVYRVEVYLLDCPFARVYEYDRNEDGVRYCWVEHGHREDDAHCDVAKRKPFDVPISSLPPGTMGG